MDAIDPVKVPKSARVTRMNTAPRKQALDRDDPEFAAKLMRKLCPETADQLLVLGQLLSSIATADEISSEVWAVTLFEDGFRLNVGAVEVLTFKRVVRAWPFESAENELDLFEIRLLMHGSVPDDLNALVLQDNVVHAIEPTDYRSIQKPQWCYRGQAALVDGILSDSDREGIATAIRLATPPHRTYIHLAAHTPLGALRKSSTFRRSHSPGLYAYAQACVEDIGESVFEEVGLNRVPGLQEELPLSQPLVEGARLVVQVNAFERNPVARRKCIEHYGTNCTVCGFSFGGAYGAAAKGYVHVHHLTSLASIGQEYEIDPIRDLRPVCANCHAVLHLRTPAYSIDEVKQMLAHEDERKLRAVNA